MTEKLSVSELTENYNAVKKRLSAALQKAGRPENAVTLLAATKTVDPETINRAIELGITHIGENRVQELLSKNGLIKPVHNHFIGHLQTNKVKQIVGEVDMIDSVDSVKVAKEIGKISAKKGIVTDVLVEINIGEEASKFGLDPSELTETLCEISEIGSVRVKGLMAIPPICDSSAEIRKFFMNMNRMFLDIKAKKLDNISMDILSMGMSGDYVEAILEGSTMVRVGSSLFGKRVY